MNKVEKQIKTEAYKKIIKLLKAQFRNAYTDGFCVTLENQMDGVLEEAIKNL